VLDAILEPLQAPSPHFSTAITGHFSHKREEVASQLLLWTEEAIVFTMFHFHLLNHLPPHVAKKIEGIFKLPIDVFERGGDSWKGLRVESYNAGTWGDGGGGGPRDFLGLGSELGRLRALKDELFPRGEAGSGSGTTTVGGGEVQRRNPLPPPPPPSSSFSSSEWEFLKNCETFWVSLTMLKASEAALKELHKVKAPEGPSGDGRVPKGELRTVCGVSCAGSKSMFERLVKSAMGRRDDVGRGWSTGFNPYGSLGED